MSRSAQMVSRCIISLCLFLSLGLSWSRAGFVGDYDESRWSFRNYGGEGSVDWLGDSCLLDSGFSGVGSVAQADLTVTAARAGTFYFTWTFYGGTSAAYKLARIRNNTATTLVSRQDYAEGNASFTASAGDTIGFRITAPLDEFPALAEISGFFAPGQEPVILTQPTPVTNCLGSIAVFSVTASNAVDYQWQFKGQNIADETSEDLAVRSAPPADSGNYRVVVRNPLGSVTSAAVPLAILNPPTISSQPTNAQTRCAGQSATISVAASGSNLRYQWRLNGTAIPGATAPSLTLSNLNPLHSGTYTVIVSNICAQITSASSLLTVLAPPVLTAQPMSTTRYISESITFFVTVAAPGSLSYQWRRNGTNLPGATSPLFTVPYAQPADAGAYSVVVNGPCGGIVSQDAILTVTGEPIAVRIHRGSNRSVSIEVSAVIGRQYVLETSDNLTTWTPTATNGLVIAGTPLFFDVSDGRARYYRVCPLP